MRILALDTSTEYCSVALALGDEIDALEAAAGRRHSEIVLAMVDELMRRHDCRVNGLDGIAFGAGPGSFTGLRIACGVTQGMAYGAGLKVVGIGTLLALAEAAGAPRVLACLDARMGQVFHAAYERAGAGWRVTHPPALGAPAGMPLLPGAGAWVGCGSGFRAHAGALRERHAGRLSAIMPDVYPHAKHIARLARPEFEGGRAVAAAAAVPEYLRDKVALKPGERSPG